VIPSLEPKCHSLIVSQILTFNGNDGFAEFGLPLIKAHHHQAHEIEITVRVGCIKIVLGFILCITANGSLAIFKQLHPSAFCFPQSLKSVLQADLQQSVIALLLPVAVKVESPWFHLNRSITKSKGPLDNHGHLALFKRIAWYGSRSESS